MREPKWSASHPKSMLKFRSRWLLALVLAATCLPQSSTKLVTPEIRRVGDKLACKCGSCNNTVATCSMLECHYSLPAREKIDSMQKAGASDQEIIDSFVKESGLVALATPPAEGFFLLGWIMPFIAIVLGLLAVGLWFKRFGQRRAVAEAPLPEIDRRYLDRMDKELQDLE
jgi:cytochrome c-type biogenesis protein CcmH/NrfF